MGSCCGALRPSTPSIARPALRRERLLAPRRRCRRPDDESALVRAHRERKSDANRYANNLCYANIRRVERTRVATVKDTMASSGPNSPRANTMMFTTQPRQLRRYINRNPQAAVGRCASISISGCLLHTSLDPARWRARRPQSSLPGDRAVVKSKNGEQQLPCPFPGAVP